MSLKASFELPYPGMFAIHFSAFDKAGNNKTSRKVLLYDNSSAVTFNPDKVTRVVTASAESSYEWVVEDTNEVDIFWQDRFRNWRHEDKGWLNKVKPHWAVDSKYDDHYGERQVDEIQNVHGMKAFLAQLDQREFPCTHFSIVCLSVNFSYFYFLLWNLGINFN